MKHAAAPGRLSHDGAAHTLHEGPGAGGEGAFLALSLPCLLDDVEVGARELACGVVAGNDAAQGQHAVVHDRELPHSPLGWGTKPFVDRGHRHIQHILRVASLLGKLVRKRNEQAQQALQISLRDTTAYGDAVWKPGSQRQPAGISALACCALPSLASAADTSSVPATQRCESCS